MKKVTHAWTHKGYTFDPKSKPDVSIRGADFGAERAFEFDFLVDAHLMSNQIAFGKVTFPANLASIVADVSMNQIHVILENEIDY